MKDFLIVIPDTDISMLYPFCIFLDTTSLTLLYPFCIFLDTTSMTLLYQFCIFLDTTSMTLLYPFCIFLDTTSMTLLDSNRGTVLQGPHVGRRPALLGCWFYAAASLPTASPCVTVEAAVPMSRPPAPRRLQHR